MPPSGNTNLGRLASYLSTERYASPPFVLPFCFPTTWVHDINVATPAVAKFLDGRYSLAVPSSEVLSSEWWSTTNMTLRLVQGSLRRYCAFASSLARNSSGLYGQQETLVTRSQTCSYYDSQHLHDDFSSITESYKLPRLLRTLWPEVIAPSTPSDKGRENEMRENYSKLSGYRPNNYAVSCVELYGIDTGGYSIYSGTAKVCDHPLLT